MKKNNDYKMVKVLWKDARSIDTDLFEEDELEQLPLLAPYVCVGFLVKETNDVVVIAQGFLPKLNPRDDLVWRHLLCIPKDRIESMRFLKEEET